MAKVRLKNCEKNSHYLEGVVLIFLGACNIKKLSILNHCFWFYVLFKFFPAEQPELFSSLS